MSKQTTGNLIATLRKEKKLTQAQLAEQMNVTDKAVSKWERDLSFPDVGSIPKLARILDITTEELLEAKEKPQKSTKIHEIIALVLCAVPLAMGIAVVVLTILAEIDGKTTGIMLGIGLFCLSLYLLDKNDKDGDK